jgi:4-amino-4-deoxy-L-arabinose transferase-like glycosyltransferase
VDRTRRNVLLLVAFFGVTYAVFARVALHAFPFSGDEYSYVLQAELFARGLLHAPAPAHADLLGVDHVVIDAWVRSKYPPGTSALLAIGVRLGVPWLVTPVEAVVTLLAMAAVARRLLGDRDVLLAVAFLGAAPLFAFQAASFFSHTAATMWLALALAAVVAWTRDGRALRLVLAGAAIGCALLTRPLDAVLFSAALLSLGSVRAAGLVAAGAAPFAALHLGYQAAQFGSPFVDGYRAYEPTFRAIYGAQSPPISIANFFDGGQLWHRLDILRAFLVEWTVPGTALVALLGWVALRGEREADRVARLAAVIVGIFTGTLLITVGGTDDGARPRYLSITLLPLALLAAPGWRSAAGLLRQKLRPRTLRVIAVVVWVLPVIQLGAFLKRRTPELEVREGLAQAVAEQRISDGVVVVRADWPTRYARNGPFFDRPVLYVSAPAGMGVDEVAASFPGRMIYEAHEGRHWSVARVR